MQEFREDYHHNRHSGHSKVASALGAGAGAIAKVATEAAAFAEISLGAKTRSVGIGFPTIAAGVFTYKNANKVRNVTNQVVASAVDYSAEVMNNPVIISEPYYSSTLSHAEGDLFLGELPSSQPATSINSSVGSQTMPLGRNNQQKEMPSQQFIAASVKKNNPLKLAEDSQQPKKNTNPEKRTYAIYQLKEAKKASDNFIRETKYKYVNKDRIFLDSKLKASLTTMAKPFTQTGETISVFGQIAKELGADTKTCEGIARAAQSIMTGAQGLMLIGQSGSFGSLTALTGYGYAILGGLSVINSFFDNFDDAGNGLQEIMEVINALRQAMIQGFQHLSKQISDNMTMVLIRLNKIIDELARIENILSVSFKELHLKELVDIGNEIKKDTDGEIKLLSDEKRKCLKSLSAWIDYHAKAKIQTSLLRDSKDVSKCLDILTDKNFDMFNLLPFFLLQLSKFLPQELADIKWDKLPNLAILSNACSLMTYLINRDPTTENYLPTLERANTQFNYVRQCIDKTINNEEVWDKLFRQYEDMRYKVGRALAKCRTEYTIRNGDNLLEHLKPGANKESLLYWLDQMEIRRVMLIHLCHLKTISQEIYTRVMQLESKQDILQKPAEEYENEAKKIIQHIRDGNYLSFKISLLFGANINLQDGCAMPMHYIPYFGCYQIKHKARQYMHELFKAGNELKCHPEDVSQAQYYGISFHNMSVAFRTRSQLGDTWGSGVLPVTYILNNGLLDLAMLFCANGYDILENEYFFMNGIQWANKSRMRYYVQLHLIREINNPKSILNKNSLRKAYQFYKEIESGFTPSIEDISHDCMLWLVCILGGLKVLKAIGTLQADVNQKLPTSRFTPLMMATYCGHEHIVDYLVEKKADRFARGEFNEKEISHLLQVALEAKNLKMVDKFIQYGHVPSTEQKKKIVEIQKAEEKEAADKFGKNLETKSEPKTLITTSTNLFKDKKTYDLIHSEISHLQRVIDLLKAEQKAHRVEVSFNADIPKKTNSQVSQLYHQLKEFYQYLEEDIKKPQNNSPPTALKKLKDVENEFVLCDKVSTVEHLKKLLNVYNALIVFIGRTNHTLNYIHGINRALDIFVKVVELMPNTDIILLNPSVRIEQSRTLKLSNKEDSIRFATFLSERKEDMSLFHDEKSFLYYPIEANDLPWVDSLLQLGVKPTKNDVDHAHKIFFYHAQLNYPYLSQLSQLNILNLLGGDKKTYHAVAGKLYYYLDQARESIEHLKKAIQLGYPDQCFLNYYLGAAHKSLKQSETAQKYANDAIMYATEILNKQHNFHAYLFRACSYELLNNMTDAVNDLKGASQCDSKEKYASYCSMSRIFYNLGKYDQAIEASTRGIDLVEKHREEPAIDIYSDLYWYRAYSCFGKKNYRQFIKDINKAIEINPSAKSAAVINKRAVAHYRLNQFAKAVENYSLAIKIEKRDYFYSNRALAYYKLDNFKEACEDYAEAILLGKNVMEDTGYLEEDKQIFKEILKKMESDEKKQTANPSSHFSSSSSLSLTGFYSPRTKPTQVNTLATSDGILNLKSAQNV